MSWRSSRPARTPPEDLKKLIVLRARRALDSRSTRNDVHGGARRRPHLHGGRATRCRSTSRVHVQVALPSEAGPPDLHRLTRRRLAILGSGFAPGALARRPPRRPALLPQSRPAVRAGPGAARQRLVYGALLGAASLAAPASLHLGAPAPGPARPCPGASPPPWPRPRFSIRRTPPTTPTTCRSGSTTGSSGRRFWLSLGTLIAFYTALLHSLHRRRYGWRSRYGLTLVALLSIFALMERREALRPRRAPAPRPAAVEAGPRPRLWVIGLDSATLDAILPLAGQGRLPFLASALQNGAYGRLERPGAARRGALWATLATGKYPFKHGVTGQTPYPAPIPRTRRASCASCRPASSFRRWGALGRQPLPAPRDPRARRWRSGRSCPAGRAGRRGGLAAAEPTAAEAAFALAEGYFPTIPKPGAPGPPTSLSGALLFRPVESDLLASAGPLRPSRAAAVGGALSDVWRKSLAARPLADQDSRRRGRLPPCSPGSGRCPASRSAASPACSSTAAQRAGGPRRRRAGAGYYGGWTLSRRGLGGRRRDRACSRWSRLTASSPGRWTRNWRQVSPSAALGGVRRCPGRRAPPLRRGDPARSADHRRPAGRPRSDAALCTRIPGRPRPRRPGADRGVRQGVPGAAPVDLPPVATRGWRGRQLYGRSAFCSHQLRRAAAGPRPSPLSRAHRAAPFEDSAILDDERRAYRSRQRACRWGTDLDPRQARIVPRTVPEMKICPTRSSPSTSPLSPTIRSPSESTVPVSLPSTRNEVSKRSSPSRWLPLSRKPFRSLCLPSGLEYHRFSPRSIRTS